VVRRRLDAPSLGGRDGAEVHLFDERGDFVEDVLDRIELLHVQRRLVIQVDGVDDAAHRKVLDVGRLAAQDRDDLVDLALVLECLQVMRHRQQVHFRRQPHRRVPPITVGEWTELTGVDEAFQLVLYALELGAAVVFPRRQTLGKL
jgi:hypothetical protein